jgi:hypothetical protein
MSGKTPAKKNTTIKKQEFDLAEFKKQTGYKSTVKDKDLVMIPLGDAFTSVTNCGIAKGYVNLFRGYTNTGKSTGMYEGIKSCQKMGILPVILDTEGNFNWEYAKNIGIEFTEVYDDEGKVVDYEGFFIFANSDALEKKYGKFDYKEGKEKTDSRGQGCIEDVAHYIDDLLDLQMKDKIPYEFCFFWDSVGSIDCFQCIMSKSKNNMWNANALESSFKAILNSRIPDSRKEGKKYTNTFCAVQKIWYDGMNNVIRHKGGESFFYAARMIYHFGGVVAHGTAKLTAVLEKKNYNFGVETKLNCYKNQVNGLTLEGKICSTPHGYITVEGIDQYKKDKKTYLLEKLGLEKGDIQIKVEEVKEVEGMFEED